MSVLIKGMDEIPDDGAVLIVKHDDDGKVYIKYAGMMGYRMELVELPENHGRLIDADATMKQWGLDKAAKYGNETVIQRDFSYSTMMMYEIADILDDAHVVIEAEGEE